MASQRSSLWIFHINCHRYNLCPFLKIAFQTKWSIPKYLCSRSSPENSESLFWRDPTVQPTCTPLLLKLIIPQWFCLSIFLVWRLNPLSHQNTGYRAKIILSLYPVPSQTSSTYPPKARDFSFFPTPLYVGAVFSSLCLSQPFSTSELPFASQCQSSTVEWKMRPISQGQGNNDWKAIEVKQTDSIQLVIAVFASVSTCEDVSRTTFLQGCLFSWLAFLLLVLVVAFGYRNPWHILLGNK